MMAIAPVEVPKKGSGGKSGGRRVLRVRTRPPTRMPEPAQTPTEHGACAKLSKEQIMSLEAELDNGEAMPWLRRFNEALDNLPEDEGTCHALMRPVWNELAYNLESFNPIFTACMLKVQCTMGHSNYEQRDEALKNMIQPLAGEYGLHHSSPMGKTHRELFSIFYESVTGDKLSDLIAEGTKPRAAMALFERMLTDVSTGGNHYDPTEQASYALGYNLAVEYLAQFEKGWMLDSFRRLDERVLSPAGKDVHWEFLEIHAEGEPEHADIGHTAVATFAPESHMDIVRKGMMDHDRDFAVFYQTLTEMLEA